MFEDSPILGDPSTIEQAKAPDALPPPPPKTVWIIPAKGNLEVHWTQAEGKVGGYHVYRREGKQIIRLTDNPVQNPPYVDRAVKQNAVYFYAVSTVTPLPDQREGLLSKWSEIRSLKFE
jgi:fibronectin type 3 domain-containing protein